MPLPSRDEYCAGDVVRGRRAYSLCRASWLPYRYDGDNIAEAYGAPEPDGEDPRGFLPLEWTLVSGPPDFSINRDTGRIQWVPTAPGNYTALVSGANNTTGVALVEVYEVP